MGADFDQRPKPSTGEISDVERAAGLRSLRPIYRILSEFVHVSPASIVSMLEADGPYSMDLNFIPAVQSVRTVDLLERIPEVLLSAARLISDLALAICLADNALTNDRTTLGLAEGLAKLTDLMELTISRRFDQIA